jgi:hypothetical protein
MREVLGFIKTIHPNLLNLVLSIALQTNIHAAYRAVFLDFL